MGHRGQRQDATFPVIVGTHDQEDVFERYHDDQRPDDQRNHAHDGGLDGHVAAGGERRFAHGVNRTGADVAIDDAQRRQRQRRLAFQAVVLHGAMG